MRLFIKRFLFLIGFILTLPLILLTYLELALLGKSAERVYHSCKEIVAMIPTAIGQYMRLGYYWAVCTHVSLDATFGFGSILAHRDITIGPGTVIGGYSIIGFAEIGKNVLFGARVSVISGKYQHGKPGQRANGDTVTEEYSRIKIGDNSWIGEGAVILSHVGSNCTVGAGSVVLKEVADNITVLGNPARKVSLN